MKKNVKEKMTKTQLQGKILKIIFLSYAIILVFWMCINNYLSDKRNIYEKIGTMEPYSVSIKDALKIKEYAIVPYADYIKSGDTQAAYDMLTDEYKAVVDYEDFLETIKGIDFETFDMKEIKMKAEGTYVATVVYERNDEKRETDYLLYLNEVNPKIITISPNKFIYAFNDLNFKKDNIELSMPKCTVYTDCISMTIIIKNTSLFDTMSFKNIGLGYGDSLNRSQNIDFTLKPGEAKEIDIDFETNYYIPNNIKIKRLMDEETLRIYTLYFDDAK